MASAVSLRSSNFCNPKTVLQEVTLNFKFYPPCSSKINGKEQKRHWLSLTLTFGNQFPPTNSSRSRLGSWKWNPPGALSSVASDADSGRSISEDECALAKYYGNKLEFNRVNCLMWVLHDSARSFSLAVQTLEFARTAPPVAMAWNGVDVHAWHKHIAYQVAAYALLKAAIEVELFLSHNRSNNPSPVHKILSPSTNLLREQIENQLRTRNPRLVQWFQVVELPRVVGLFMPLFKKWSVEYAGSGVAGTIMAITCCAAVGKLGSGRISCPVFLNSTEAALIELMNMANDLVSVDKLHYLATEAGFEEHFLYHFGSKILPYQNMEDIEFWIGLVQRKLSAALEREGVIKGRDNLSDKIQGNSLATLAIFAYLGRESRLFLSRQNIKDIDEQIKDFLCYLECGILFIYPGFSTLSMYQLLMEAIVDEIGWLDFFAAYNNQLCEERRRSKHHPTQAEKEIILYTVFTICYDVISGFAHYSSSTQQTLDSDLLEFLLQSQGLLSACLDDYWAAYDTSDLPRIGEIFGADSAPSFLIKGTKSTSLIVDARQRPDELRTRVKHTQAESLVDLGDTAASNSTKQGFLKKSAMKLIAASVDIGMGTRLLFVDIADTFGFLVKQICGHKLTKRQRKKIKKTAQDLSSLIPITILMLLPVSAVGHAAMFAAIKRYAPFLIPSPYWDDRLDLVRQLKRTKKMKFQRINIDENLSCSGLNTSEVV